SLLVNTGLEGHPCGDDGTCLNGYSCNTSNICVKNAEVACNTACSATEVCVQQKCVNKCSAEACAPGSTCSDGSCQPITTSGILGSSCTQDADCGGSPLVCLLPYGGEKGVCTEGCDPTTNLCATSGQICEGFTADSQSGTLNLCADPSLKPCTRNSDCSATPGFVCGVAHV